MSNSLSDINNYEVNVGDTAIITGDVEFNSLGEKTVNLASIDHTPMYSIELSNPKFIRGSEQLKKFVFNVAYTRHGSDSKFVSFKSKSPNAPRLFDNNNSNSQGTDAREYLIINGKAETLQRGQQVYVAIRVFRGKGFNNKGIGLQAVKVEDLNHLKLENKEQNVFNEDTNSFHS